MVETKDYEIITIEKELLNIDVIKGYVASEFIDIYMVVVDHGRFVGFFNNTILLEEIKKDKLWKEDCLIINSVKNSRELFGEARKYFDTIRNRNYPLPIINEEGELLTFFVWNEHLEKTGEYLKNQKNKILELLERGYELEFKNWDEYTNEYVCSILQTDIVPLEKIKFSGRNWELYNMLEKRSISINTENKYCEGDCLIIDNTGIQYPTKEHDVVPLLDVVEGLKKYNNKKIYVWLRDYLINNVIGKIIFQYGYWIGGFCELRSNREITRLLGKNVVNLEDIIEKEDVLILVYDKEDVDYLDAHFQKGKAILWNEMINLRKDIIHREKFQTWGERAEIDIFKKSIGVEIVSENSFTDREESALLVWEKAECSKTPENYGKYIKRINSKVKWYSWDRVYETLGNEYAETLKLRNLDIAIENNKKIIIYGIESHYTNQWIHLLECIGVTYQFMEDEEIQDWYGYHVESVFELPYYNLNDILVIINKPYEMLDAAMDLLSNYNISLEENNAILVYGCNSNLNRGKIFVDVCAGTVPQILIKEKYPCYYVIGEPKEENYKIMTLGGSTTESTLYTYDSWPEILGKMFDKERISVTIYNGGIAGYTSIQECTKLIRDIKYIEPDMVISFSGVNDSSEEIHQKGYTYGMEKRSVVNWIQNEKMMNYICEQYGAKFYGFVQPQIYHKDFNDTYWKLFTKRFHSERFLGWKETIEKQKECPWIINLLDILDNHLNVYFDACHVTTEGNQIIANHIYNHIIDDIRQGVK